MRRRPAGVVAAVIAAAAITTAATTSSNASDPDVNAAGRNQTTLLISRTPDGNTPNGPSTNPVISGDRRYVRVIGFESEATDLVRGDDNGAKDVFAIKRTGTVDNSGRAYQGGDPILVSRGLNGASADGPSHSVSLSGDFRNPGGCIAFLSDATNLVSGDTNGVTDAFLVKSAGDAPTRVSLPSNKEATTATTGVSVSGDCSRVAFVTGGKVYVRAGNSTKALATKGNASDPSFATGNSNDLVFAARGGVYLSTNASGTPKLVGRGGRNPVYNNLKRRTLAYEKTLNRRSQIYYGDIGKKARVISKRGKRNGNGNSTQPTIGNSGFYVTFETTASNLTTSAAGTAGDRNNRPDSYLFSDSRDMTLVQSVEEKGVPLPAGGENPSMSYYANYIVFDSPGPLGTSDSNGNRQIYMRYLGGI